MAFQPVSDVCEVVLEHRYNGASEPYDMVWHFQHDSPDLSYVTALANAVADAWDDNLAPLAPSTAQLVQVRVRDLTTEDGARFVLDANRPGTGAATDWLPPNCAVGVIFRCGGAGFPRHGFTFWPFVLEADCDRVGTLSGDAITVPAAVQATVVDVEAVIGLATTDHVVVSRWETVGGASVQRDPALINAVTAYAIGRNGFVASQRDRRPGQ